MAEEGDTAEAVTGEDEADSTPLDQEVNPINFIIYNNTIIFEKIF